MRKFENYTLESAYHSGRHLGESRTISYNFNREAFEDIFLPVGLSDDISVYREGADVYILGTNEPFGYYSLTVIFRGNIIGEVYFTDNDISECDLPSIDSAPYTIIRALLEYIY